jgi:hypothetical protein
MTGETSARNPNAPPNPAPVNEFNPFGFGSEEVAMRYLQAVRPGTVWTLGKLWELTNAAR